MAHGQRGTVTMMSTATQGSAKRVILLMSGVTYRGTAFINAAERLGLEVVRGLDMPRPLARHWRPTLPLDFRDPDRAVRDLVAYAYEHPVGAILAVDDAATIIAAGACAARGLAHNSPDAALAARDKSVMRQRFAATGVPSPAFRLYHTDDDPAHVAREVSYPCVVKPTTLSGSQGVIRANTPEELARAWTRTRSIVLCANAEGSARPSYHILVEDYIPGVEVVVEGILAAGRLTPLAIFDKPDPLTGPFFEETIYVTPSRLPATVQDAIVATAAEACAALGLREGPVHAELRVDDAHPWVVEVAGRSIGGLCAKILRFGTEGTSLEELILRAAVGMGGEPPHREERAGGVMMIPIPRAGILKAVQGLDEAKAVVGVEEIDLTIPVRRPVTPLPEGAQYLGFIFARGATPDAVEAALREAHRRLRFTIVPELRVLSPRQQ